jgi:hypothetical protein
VELPNLEGQPAWVVVLVVFLFIAGPIGVAWVNRKGKEDPETPPQVEPPGDTLSLSPMPVVMPFDPVKEAMGHLATSAAKNAQDADRAEQEAKDLARQLAECSREMGVLQVRYDNIAAELAACRAQQFNRQENGR